MNEDVNIPRRRGMLVAPTYGYGETIPRRPSLREILVEWFDAINFLKDRARLAAALYVVYHLATGCALVVFFVQYFSLWSVAYVMGAACAIATVYNTVWYHRYCTHRAFTFRSVWFARLFLWTNPVCFREESYVIPHRVHHHKSDQPGDPYGPHLGWLGSYLATESQQKTNRDISRKEFERLAKSLEHIGLVTNGYEKFQQTGSIEKTRVYLARMLFANLFWCGITYWVAGWFGVLGWLGAVFLFTFLVRDFNYRGHGGGFFRIKNGPPLNQIFYGVIAGEWHENHHAQPRSSRAGFTWWQIDLPYWTIRVMHACGAVTHYHKPLLNEPHSTNPAHPDMSAEAG